MKRGFLKTDKAKDALEKNSPSESDRSPPIVSGPTPFPENKNTAENTNSIMKRDFLKTDKAKVTLDKDSPSECDRSPQMVSHPIQKPESVFPENQNTEENTNKPEPRPGGSSTRLGDPPITSSTDLHSAPP